MIRRYLVILLCVYAVLSAGASSRHEALAQAADPSKGGVEAAAGTKEDLEDQKRINEAKEKAEEAMTEAEMAKQEVEVSKKEIEIQKQKAEIEKKEAEIAKKEAEAIKEITESGQKIREALDKVKEEEKEAEAALSLVEIKQLKALAAEEKARIREQEVEVAREKARIAGAKIREKRKKTYSKLVQTTAVIFFGYLLLFILVSVVNRRVSNLKRKHLLRKYIVYALNLLMIIYLVFIWSHNIQSITIFFSAIGAGVALALHEAILCMAGWLYLLIRRPYEVGDRIELGGVRGDVIDIRIFNTTLLEIGNWVDSDQSTGRIVDVPNSYVFRQASFNYNRGFEFIWNEIKVLVTFESDWKRAKEIMMEHGRKEAEGMEDIVKRKINKMTLQYMIFFDKLTPIVYVSIKDSGVELTLRYLTEAQHRRPSQDRITQAILDDFEKERKVNFAYPTYRIVRE